MPIRYSYDALEAFRTPEGRFGWVHHRKPATVHHRGGIDFGIGMPSTSSFPPGLTEPPAGSLVATYRHQAGACAGGREWDHSATYRQWPDAKEPVEEWALLSTLRELIARGEVDPDPEHIL